MSTLAHVIAELSQLPDELVIYAAPRWRASSPAIACREPRDGSLPAAANGMTYMLDVAAAKRAVRERRRWRADRTVSLAELVKAVIYMAVYDQPEPLPSVFSSSSISSEQDLLPLAV